MAKSTNLVITDVLEDHRLAFLNLAEVMELSRGQLLALLMVGAKVIDSGAATVIPDPHAKVEWCDLMARRFFELGNL